MNILSSYDKEQQEKSIQQQSTANFTDHECDHCSKVFASEYGLHYHINMHHPNQSILCSDCNLTFRSHRALKNHQQRFHFTASENLPNYNHISAYLVVPFSTQQFPLMATDACERGRFPLGGFASKLFQCQLCSLSFPTSNSLEYHRLSKHEQYEYRLCQNILYEIVVQVEQTLRTADRNDEEVQTMKFLLATQASHFGLIDKQLARESRSIKHECRRLIFPPCEHENRTCANLCLQNLSSYYELMQNYPYKITKEPKGNPFAQGSIVSNSSINSSITSKETFNSNHKRPSLKRLKSSPQSKRKLTEQPFITTDQSTSTPTSPKKSFLKINHSYTRSLSSMSSTSSTSTRSSSKNSGQQFTASSKRSRSPNIALAVELLSERRRRQREERKAKALSLSSSSSATIKIHDDIEQENGDDEIIPIQSKKPKQRQASNSSVEYVQVINNDQSSISSLNNIENFKLKSPSNDDDIIICHPPSSVKKTHPKTSVNGVHKITSHQTTDYDEHVRVRCKICGDILDGRSRFSKHVLTMHSHLIKSNLSDIKQQPTTVVYSV